MKTDIRFIKNYEMTTETAAMATQAILQTIAF